MSKGSKSPRSRNWMYTQQLDHLPPDLTLDVLRSRIRDNLPSGTWAALIVHDKDTYTKRDEAKARKDLGDQFDVQPQLVGQDRTAWIEQNLTVHEGDLKPAHVHASFALPNAKTATAIAACIGDKPQYFEKFDGTPYAKQNLFAYLVHRTEKSQAEGKHKYDVSEVISDPVVTDDGRVVWDYSTYLAGVTTMLDASGIDEVMLFEKVHSGEIRLLDFFRDKTLAAYYWQNKTKVDRLFDLRYKWLMKEGNRPTVKVIYIQGEPGSGKSTYARKYALKNYGDYCVSSGHNDPVQDYCGERCLLLDDARPGDFSASDWLKMLDPYNSGATVTSRYFNKYLAVECIIITTTVPFEDFFAFAPKKGGREFSEPVNQFMRRFDSVIKTSLYRDEVADCRTSCVDVYPVIECVPYLRRIPGFEFWCSYRLADFPLYSSTFDLGPLRGEALPMLSVEDSVAAFVAGNSRFDVSDV